MNPILVNNNGQILMYDGTVIYVEDFKFSADGATYLEDTYNPNTHLYSDGITQIPPHKYIHIKKAGDDTYQLPAKFIGDDGTDGDSVELRVSDGNIQWRLTQGDDNSWTTIVALSDLKGDQGIEGEGLNIDYSGALDARGVCPITTTNTCGCNGTVTTGLRTYLSVGNHLLTTDDIADEVTYWHSYDGTTFVQSTDEDEDKAVVAWRATVDDGTGALTCNYQGTVVALASLVTPYNSSGKVYACSLTENGTYLWTEFSDISAESGLVKVSSGDSAQYLENKVDNSTIEAYDSGDGYNDKLRIKDAGIAESKLNASVAGNGLTGGGGSPLAVGAGNGLTVNTNDVEVKLYAATVTTGGDNDAVGNPLYLDSTNGLNVKIDGTTIGTDATNNYRLEVKDNSIDENKITESLAGDGLTGGNGTALSVVVDNSTIEIDGVSGEAQLKDDGVTGDKLAPAVAGNALAQDGSGNLDVQVDDSSIEITANTLNVKENGIEGTMLNDNTCDETTGVSVTNDKITINIDDNKMEMNGNDISVKDSYVQSLAPQAGASVTTLDGNATAGTNDTFSASDHKHDFAANSIAQSKVVDLTTDLASKVVLNTWYGALGSSIAVSSGSGDAPFNGNPGLLIKSSGGNVFKLTVDDSGNLGTSSL